MRRKLFLCSIAILLITISSVFILVSNTSAMTISRIVVDTPTPDTTTVLKDASDAVTHAQDILNVVNIFAAILAVVLTFVSVVAVVLTLLGARTYREFHSLTAEYRTNVKEAKKTRDGLLFLGLGDRLLSKNNINEALQYYQRAGDLLPKDAEINYILGRIYSGVGKYQEAINSLEASHPEENVDKAKVRKELGLAYRRRGSDLNQESDFDKAIQCLSDSTTLNPYDSDTWAILGGLYRRKKEYTQAYESYEKARRIDPDSSYALGNLASLAWRLGKLQEAHHYFEQTEKVATERIKKGQTEIYWDYYDLALAQLATGKIAEAKDTYQKAIKVTPGKVQFDSVLNNLHLLQEAPHPMPNLDEIVKMIEDAENR